ncbi:hypothetical protein A2801_02085 [Candidatus Woesebacteria bacterium RIFCSPHIGHO2_01_FULL_41_10]|uniref:Uncharacterized protein n=1 Tax=Candidatus Woesebacteria bacterium RIFCSPHIGHO2_01_FULL_41_10 TaxID=1802500 RepID=A0A1F7YPT0_9BACT|nr:MAG: hypothetical protein A2801_02085 [Candidatus Woesebacteria bacterium RIFCSPHIGHO2_01_FULL_41_10]
MKIVTSGAQLEDELAEEINEVYRQLELFAGEQPAMSDDHHLAFSLLFGLISRGVMQLQSMRRHEAGEMTESAETVRAILAFVRQRMEAMST